MSDWEKDKLKKLKKYKLESKNKRKFAKVIDILRL
jgi:hypothetical protein